MTCGSAAADHTKHEGWTTTTEESGRSIDQHCAGHRDRDEVPVAIGSDFCDGAWSRADTPRPVRALFEHASVCVRTITRSATRLFSRDAGIRVPIVEKCLSDAALRAVEEPASRTSRSELLRWSCHEGLGPACRHAYAS